MAWFARIDSHDSRRIGWFARITSSSDLCESAWRAINIGVSIANDSRESRCESPVPLRSWIFRRGKTTPNRWSGSWGQQIQNLLEGAMKQMLFQARSLGLLDEAGSHGTSSSQHQKTRTEQAEAAQRVLCCHFKIAPKFSKFFGLVPEPAKLPVQYWRAETSPKFSSSAGNNFWEISGISRKILTSTGFYWCCAPTRQHQ